MKRILTLAALLAAGCAAALSLGATRASAWSPTDLPPGWAVSSVDRVGAAPGTYCINAYRIWTANRADFSDAFCADSPTFQADFDGWVNARYSPPPASTTATTETLPPVTTTVVITTTTPGTTTTTPPADGSSAPAPAAPAVTNAVTVTTTVTPVEQSLQAQIDALSAQISALTDRVTRLEKASDAAWLAYQQAIENGDSTAVAAEIARGTALNVIYGLGAFAP